jgi:DNA-binding NarL/FixJ family response regulator
VRPGSVTIRAVPTSVLIVDDHPSFRACARQVLEAEGFEVVGEAADVASALAAAERLRPDVVLLDVQLPDGDGFDLARECCRDGEADGPRPRIVLVSSRDRSDYGSLIEDCGAVGFIPKDELSGQTLADLLK